MEIDQWMLERLRSYVAQRMTGVFDLEFESEDPEFLAYIERMVDFLHFLSESEPPLQRVCNYKPTSFATSKLAPMFAEWSKSKEPMNLEGLPGQLRARFPKIPLSFPSGRDAFFIQQQRFEDKMDDIKQVLGPDFEPEQLRPDCGSYRHMTFPAPTTEADFKWMAEDFVDALQIKAFDFGQLRLLDHKRRIPGQPSEVGAVLEAIGERYLKTIRKEKERVQKKEFQRVQAAIERLLAATKGFKFYSNANPADSGLPLETEYTCETASGGQSAGKCLLFIGVGAEELVYLASFWG